MILSIILRSFSLDGVLLSLGESWCCIFLELEVLNCQHWNQCSMLPSASDSELQLAVFWHSQKASLGFKVTVALRLFFCWAFAELHFCGKCFQETAEVGEVICKEKRQWSTPLNFGLCCCCCLFACLFSFFLLSSVWLNRSHLSVFRMISYPLHMLGVTSGTRDGDPHGRLKCERVKYTII